MAIEIEKDYGKISARHREIARQLVSSGASAAEWAAFVSEVKPYAYCFVPGVMPLAWIFRWRTAGRCDIISPSFSKQLESNV